MLLTFPANLAPKVAQCSRNHRQALWIFERGQIFSDLNAGDAARLAAVAEIERLTVYVASEEERLLQHGRIDAAARPPLSPEQEQPTSPGSPPGKSRTRAASLDFSNFAGFCSLSGVLMA